MYRRRTISFLEGKGLCLEGKELCLEGKGLRRPNEKKSEQKNSTCRFQSQKGVQKQIPYSFISKFKDLLWALSVGRTQPNKKCITFLRTENCIISFNRECFNIVCWRCLITFCTSISTEEVFIDNSVVAVGKQKYLHCNSSSSSHELYANSQFVFNSSFHEQSSHFMHFPS